MDAHMKTLSKNEWIAVAVSVFVVGFFFIFGQTLISALTGEAQTPVSQGAAVQVADDTMGSGAVAQAGDLVTINYTGTFIDGTVFDSSVARKEPYQFTLGSAQTIPASPRASPACASAASVPSSSRRPSATEQAITGRSPAIRRWCSM
jgi:hypothetical protein